MRRNHGLANVAFFEADNQAEEHHGDFFEPILEFMML
jgi:hypothetical protein